MEIRKLDVQQANQHVSLLSSFMPDSFVRRGGMSAICYTCAIMDKEAELPTTPVLSVVLQIFKVNCRQICDNSRF